MSESHLIIGLECERLFSVRHFLTVRYTANTSTLEEDTSSMAHPNPTVRCTRSREITITFMRTFMTCSQH